MGIKGIEAIKAALEKHQGGGKTKFFSLPDNGDTAKVRYLHKDENDLNVYVVHQVIINGKKRWVECLDNDNCPLCRAGNQPQVKMFLYLIDKRDGEVKLWERGRTQIPELLGYIERYGNLCDRDYEIVRHGRKNDPKTRYQHFPLDKSVITLPERPEVAGDKGFVLVKSIEDMTAIANGTYVPDTGNGGGNGTDRPVSMDDEDVF